MITFSVPVSQMSNETNIVLTMIDMNVLCGIYKIYKFISGSLNFFSMPVGIWYIRMHRIFVRIGILARFIS